jgi:hypothetical protein
MLKQAAHSNGERERMWWRWVYISSNVDVQKAVLARARLKKRGFDLDFTFHTLHNTKALYIPTS